MTKFHYEILSEEQKQISELIEKFNKQFILVGGTAISLWIGHRKSIDYDLFLPRWDILPMRTINSELNKSKRSFHEHVKESFHYEWAINKVKITRYAYPYDIPLSRTVQTDFTRIPNAIILSCNENRCFFNGRWKRKDYVDIYFLIKRLGLKDILDYTKEVFNNRINMKLFASQLSYFDDISYKEAVEFMPRYEVSEDEIKNSLIQYSKNCRVLL